TPAEWFNTAAFSNPLPYTFGNAPRTFNGTRDDGVSQVDVSLHKNTTIREKLMLQFRVEAFNITNTPQFAPPNASFGNSLFGVVSAQSNQPRILQLALKLIL
ncbi:MAG: hypothetical protein ABI165_13235, partial [Bryobacteraceae bacterium]